jgi:hypothetical protein
MSSSDDSVGERCLEVLGPSSSSASSSASNCEGLNFDEVDPRLSDMIVSVRNRLIPLTGMSEEAGPHSTLQNEGLCQAEFSWASFAVVSKDVYVPKTFRNRHRCSCVGKSITLLSLC